MNINITLCDFCLRVMNSFDSTHTGKSDGGGVLHTCVSGICRLEARKYFDKLHSVRLERDSLERSIKQKYKHDIDEHNEALSDLYDKKNKELDDNTPDFLLTPLQGIHGQNSSCVKVLGVELKNEQA